ncbi:MAG TPA: nucleoside hydrolase [Alphaproteobacteria bacterium]|nr:nucleoside hydrolase [Alphaproteobacteria bacterium]
MARKIIIDTDPGQDDAVAILTALASPEDFEVLGIVGVAGNVPQPLSVKNALKVVELAGRPDVPVYPGSDRPMRRQLVTAEYVHGKSGLDGPDLPEPAITARAEHGVDFIIDSLRAHPEGEVTLCPLGPLTDIATAFVKAPDVVGRVREIVMMGGGYFEGGNTTPVAEFNIYVDPEAADIVMRSGVPITMVPLDLSHQMLSTSERIAAFRALGNRAGVATAEMLEFFERFDEQKYGWDGGPLHDPCVIAYLLEPGLFKGRTINVTIETSSELTLGMTVADYWGVTDRPRNVHFLRSGDADGYYRLLTERIARLP